MALGSARFRVCLGLAAAGGEGLDFFTFGEISFSSTIFRFPLEFSRGAEGEPKAVVVEESEVLLPLPPLTVGLTAVLEPEDDSGLSEVDTSTCNLSGLTGVSGANEAPLLPPFRFGRLRVGREPVEGRSVLSAEAGPSNNSTFADLVTAGEFFFRLDGSLFAFEVCFGGVGSLVSVGDGTAGAAVRGTTEAVVRGTMCVVGFRSRVDLLVGGGGTGFGAALDFSVRARFLGVDFTALGALRLGLRPCSSMGSETRGGRSGIPKMLIYMSSPFPRTQSARGLSSRTGGVFLSLQNS